MIGQHYRELFSAEYSVTVSTPIIVNFPVKFSIK